MLTLLGNTLRSIVRPAVSLRPLHIRSLMAGPAPIDGRPFRLALIQLGGTGPNKSANLEAAKLKIAEAAKGDAGGKPDLIVLPVSCPPLSARPH